MTAEMIQIAQQYLTIKENGKSRKIVDLERLLRAHPSGEVIELLKTILREKQAALKEHVSSDKTKKEVDETVAFMFRITMAIKTLENGKEVSNRAGAKRAAGGGG